MCVKLYFICTRFHGELHEKHFKRPRVFEDHIYLMRVQSLIVTDHHKYGSIRGTFNNDYIKEREMS